MATADGIERALAQNENRPFAWPKPHARSDRSKDALVLERGYMRSILTDPEITKVFGIDTTTLGAADVAKLGHRKLNFQFNPESIIRSVSQSQGAVNPLLQNPANLTVPTPGTANFDFVLTFNREMEVANYGAQGKFFNGVSDTDALFQDDSLRDPGYVGVWADLQILDLIIGQGISKDLLDILTFYYNKSAELAPTKSETGNASTSKEDTFNTSDFKKMAGANYGNSAFLNPLPVRVVFSKAFMIEGFVVGSEVAFQKFNAKMIPTVCQVALRMNALYIGFSKKKAFVTDSLVDWAKSSRDTGRRAEDLNKTAKDQIGREFKKLRLTFNRVNQQGSYQSSNDKHLKTPDYNSLGMKVWHPKNVLGQETYPGNLEPDASRFVSIQQWVNFYAPTGLTSNAQWSGNNGPDGQIRSNLAENQQKITPNPYATFLPVVIDIDYFSSDLSAAAIGNKKGVVPPTFTVTASLSQTVNNKTITIPVDIRQDNNTKWEMRGGFTVSPSSTPGVSGSAPQPSEATFRTLLYWRPKTIAANTYFNPEADVKLEIEITAKRKVTLSGTTIDAAGTTEKRTAVFKWTDALFYKDSTQFVQKTFDISRGRAD